ncbi:Major facilitator superfamily like protein, partial [Aduncisulcus paluster]
DGGYWAIVAIRAASGIAALIAPLGYLCVSDLSPPKTRTLNLCIYTSAIYISCLFSPVINHYVVEKVIPDDPSDDDYIRVLQVDAFIAMLCRVFAGIFAMIFTKESSPIILANRELKAQAKAAKKLAKKDAAIEMTVTKKEEVEEPKEEGDKFKHSKFWSVFKFLFTNRDFILLFIAYTMCVGAYSVVRDLNLAWMTDMPFNDLWTNFTDADQPYDTDGVVWPVSYLAQFKSNYPKWLSNYQYVSALAIYGFVAFCALVVGPWFTRRAGEMNMTFVSHVMNLLALILQGITPPLVDTVWASAVFSAIGAFSEACAHPAYLYMLSLFSLPTNRGSVTGISQIGNSVGRAVPTLLIGLTFDALESVGPITVTTNYGDITLGNFALDDSKGYYTYLTAIPMVFIGVICQMFARVPILRHELDFRQTFIDEIKKHSRAGSVMDLDKFTRIRNFSVAERTLHKPSSGSVSA